MSDPRGNHACEFAKEHNEFNGVVYCTVKKDYIRCSGVTEYCELDNSEIWKITEGAEC